MKRLMSFVGRAARRPRTWQDARALRTPRARRTAACARRRRSTA